MRELRERETRDIKREEAESKRELRERLIVIILEKFAFRIVTHLMSTQAWTQPLLFILWMQQ